MSMILAKSENAKKAYELVRSLQYRFVEGLNKLSEEFGENKPFQEVTWLRDEGIHGGGSRFEAKDNVLFNTASVNVSQVHYDDMEDKQLQSATAISTIIHPKNPNISSIHIHISLTCLRSGHTYWRVMADLNPAIVFEEDKNSFSEAIKTLAKTTYEEGTAQGDKYFNIPALERHRGIVHFYLENYKTQDEQADGDFALKFGQGVIDKYLEITKNAIQTRTSFSVQDIKAQLDYHTLYLFQVLTLDRGTTSGLLIHNQNDVGIMGSLPSFINKTLLASWATKVETPQDILVNSLVEVINDKGIIDALTKEKLASVVREHYKKYPESLKYQASGNSIPSTVANHNK